MDKNDGGPAFPTAPIVQGKDHVIQIGDDGMSLRDWFAGQALANSSICRHDDDYPQRTAYSFADAMIAERSK